MPSRSEPLVLVWDVGTSAVKAALFDRRLRLVASAMHPLQLQLPAPGHAEQSPSAWWEAMVASCGELLRNAQVRARDIAAVSIASQMAACVPVDASGEALRPALIWLDSRSAGEARRLMRGYPKISGYGAWRLLRWLRTTNGAPSLAGKDPVSKYLWLRAREPRTWQRTTRLLDIKDYLLARLSGVFTTTPDCAHLTWLMDSRTRAWSPSLLRSVGIDRGMLPDIVANDSDVGGLRGEAAAALGLTAGTRVIAGCGDITACALGSGAAAPGAAHLYLGTSSWVAAHLERRRVDPLRAIGSLCAARPDRHLYIATQESAGGALAWAADALGAARAQGTDWDLVNREAGASPPGAAGARFHPWLQGERVPVDDARLRGGFLGLSMASSRGDLWRAVMEGVALNTRWALDSMQRSVRIADGPLPLSGGVAASDPWCAILSDVLERPVARVVDAQAGVARGAAVVAGVALGWFGDVDQGASLVVHDRVFEPDADRGRIYRTAYRDFLRAHRGLAKLYHGWMTD